LKSSCSRSDSACELDGGGHTFHSVMDAAGIAMGIAAFAILLALIYGIERI
jgi:hypothetical protein